MATPLKHPRALTLTALVVVTLAAALYWMSQPKPAPAVPATPIPAPRSTPPPAIPSKPPEPAAPPVRTSPDHSPLADQLNAPDNTPQRDLEILKGILGQFTTTLKPGLAPPMGDNQDITAALTGHNKLGIVFIPPNHPAIDDQGRLLDRWGTPYFFHARSADTFDLRSAGPDKVLFTADDVVRAWK